MDKVLQNYLDKIKELNEDLAHHQNEFNRLLAAAVSKKKKTGTEEVDNVEKEKEEKSRQKRT